MKLIPVFFILSLPLVLAHRFPKCSVLDKFTDAFCNGEVCPIDGGMSESNAILVRRPSKLGWLRRDDPNTVYYRKRIREDLSYWRELKDRETTALWAIRGLWFAPTVKCVSKNSIMLEYVNAKDGYHWVRDRVKKRLDVQLSRDLLTVFKRTAESLEYLHQLGFVHGDVKPENILVLDRSEMPAPVQEEHQLTELPERGVDIKLIDFGGTSKVGERSITGTIPYCAPELLKRPKPMAQQNQDVYSLGKMIGRICFESADQFFLSLTSTLLSDLRYKMTDDVPDRRPSMKEVKKKLSEISRVFEMEVSEILSEMGYSSQ